MSKNETNPKDLISSTQTTDKEEYRRFTTTISPTLLSQIKLISYFTNQTLSNSINQSIQLYIEDFETKNNTSIQSIINLQNTQK